MKKFDTINVIPFIDIMLVLLAIVLAVASFINQGKIEVNVPQSESQAQLTTDDIVELITLKKEGTYFYKDQPITLAKLQTVIAQFSSTTQVTLKVDAESDFQQFISVTDLLKTAALKKIAIITVQPSPKVSE